MARLVKRDLRLQLGLDYRVTPNEYNVKFHADDGSVYVRHTGGNDEMRNLADKLADAMMKDAGLFREDWQNKLISWVTENIPGTTWYITLQFYTEPKLHGNMREFYYIRKKKDIITLGGSAMRYRYVTRAAAVKNAKYLFDLYTKKQKEDGQDRQVEVILHEQYLTGMPREILKLY